MATDGWVQAPEHAPVVLDAQDLVKRYEIGRELRPSRRRHVTAVADVSLEIHRGETLGLVGESGSGKSTLGRILLGQTKPDAGQVFVDGEDLASARGVQRRRLRRRVQAVFQDPLAALDPRRTAGQSIGEPLSAFGIGDRNDRPDRVADLLAEVGLAPSFAESRPHQLSGGQRQRVVIARALASEPGLVIADEPVSALDVSVQAQILNLLLDLQERSQVAFLLISHDLAVVRSVAHRVAVLYRGRVVEVGSAAQVLGSPVHHYTRRLQASSRPLDMPATAASAPAIVGSATPGDAGWTTGCAYRTLCPAADARCGSENPALVVIGHGHLAACHHPA